MFLPTPIRDVKESDELFRLDDVQQYVETEVLEQEAEMRCVAKSEVRHDKTRLAPRDLRDVRMRYSLVVRMFLKR